MPLFTFHEIRQLMSVSSSYNFIEATEGTLEKEMLAPIQILKSPPHKGGRGQTRMKPLFAL